MDNGNYLCASLRKTLRSLRLKSFFQRKERKEEDAKKRKGKGLFMLSFD
jgi:hypothetical protein